MGEYTIKAGRSLDRGVFLKELSYHEVGPEFEGTITIGVEHPTRPEIIDSSYAFTTVSDTGMGMYVAARSNNPFSRAQFSEDKGLNDLITRSIAEVVCAQRPVQQKRHGFDQL